MEKVDIARLISITLFFILMVFLLLFTKDSFLKDYENLLVLYMN